MADCISDNVIESSRDANAHVARSSALADLESQTLERLIDGTEWRNSDPIDFISRAVAEHCRINADEQGNPQNPGLPRSSTSSMAATIHTYRTPLGSSGSSSKTASSFAPSLDSSSTVRSSSSAYSVALAHLAQTYAIGEEGDSTSESSAADDVDLACSFSFLACNFRSDDVAEWNTHCQSHFRGHLPKKAVCPFAHCDWSTLGDTGEEAWRQRSFHVYYAHRGRGVVDISSRPDPSLVQHLWQYRLIGDAEKKELRQHGRLSNKLAFTSSAGSDRDRRRSRRPPTTVRV